MIPDDRGSKDQRNVKRDRAWVRKEGKTAKRVIVLPCTTRRGVEKRKLESREDKAEKKTGEKSRQRSISVAYVGMQEEIHLTNRASRRTADGVGIYHTSGEIKKNTHRSSIARARRGRAKTPTSDPSTRGLLRH